MLERVRAALESQRAALEARNRALRTRLTPAVAIDKPESHRREYRAFVLPNELRVLVASDPAADKAAAALCVDAGRLSEPKAIPGLAIDVTGRSGRPSSQIKRHVRSVGARPI